MLGVYIAPDGNCSKQFESMMQKATEYSERIKTCYTYRHEAWLALTTMAMKSIDYALPATTLTESECDQIMWRLLKSFLPKSGVNRYIVQNMFNKFGGKMPHLQRPPFFPSEVSAPPAGSRPCCWPLPLSSPASHSSLYPQSFSFYRFHPLYSFS